MTRHRVHGRRRAPPATGRGRIRPGASVARMAGTRRLPAQIFGLAVATIMLGCGSIVQAGSWAERSGLGGIHDPWNVEAVIAAGPIEGDDAYHEAMFGIFVALARDRESVLDWRGVEFYLDKAKRMLKGELPDPTVVFDPALMILWRAPLEAARARFMAARDGGGRSLAPDALAQAHGFLDCWIREAMENHVGVELPEQMECRMSFDWAMLEVEHKMSSDAVVLLPGPDDAAAPLRAGRLPGRRHRIADRGRGGAGRHRRRGLAAGP